MASDPAAVHLALVTRAGAAFLLNWKLSRSRDPNAVALVLSSLRGTRSAISFSIQADFVLRP